MEELRTVGDRLRWARLRAALTMDELSERTGVTKTTISRIETGRNAAPRVSTMRQLGLALGVDPGWLLAGDDVDVEAKCAA